MGCDRSDVVGRGGVCLLGGVGVRIIVFAAGREASGVGVTEGVVLDCVDDGIGGVRVCVCERCDL